MKLFLRIAYWVVALALLTTILVSLDYTLAQAVLISLIFCPCALALEFFMPKAKRPMDKVYLSLTVLVSIILLILVLHESVWSTITQGTFVQGMPVPPMLINPVFLGLILTTLSIGDFFWARWLSSKRFKAKDRTITFFSERRSVTLPVRDITYIESNDTEVRIVTASGESYRNKTGIGQWENLLGDDFLRIHRSYLVNLDTAVLISPDTVQAGNTQLPVSRKYKDAVKSALSNTRE